MGVLSSRDSDSGGVERGRGLPDGAAAQAEAFAQQFMSLLDHKESLSFTQHEEGMYHVLWKRPSSNPGPWVPSVAL
jgi:hypothetical protein